MIIEQTTDTRLYLLPNAVVGLTVSLAESRPMGSIGTGSQAGVRRRSDLPRADPARVADRTEHVLRGEVPAALARAVRDARLKDEFTRV